MNMINIFLPKHISVHSRHVLFGVVQNFRNYTIVNCVGSLNFDQDDFVESAIRVSNNRNLSIVGFINTVSSEHRSVGIPNNLSKDIYFVLHVDSESKIVSVERSRVKGQDVKQIRMIIYDTKDVLQSCLVQGVGKGPVNEMTNDTEDLNFPMFLKNTAAGSYLKEFSDGGSNSTQHSLHFINKVVTYLTTFLYKIIVAVFLQYEYFYRIFAERFPKVASKAIQLSSVGSHVQRRFHHIHQITSSFNENTHFPLSSGNLVSAIIFDILCGWMFTYLFWHYCSPLFLLQIALKYASWSRIKKKVKKKKTKSTNKQNWQHDYVKIPFFFLCNNFLWLTKIIVNELKLLLHWLMGIPAGLKLNLPLNTALGHFFLYHIYLWKTYIAVVRPIFAFVLEGVPILSTFGLTFIICLCNDLLSMATIHIYCFYGYAAKLYGYQVAGIASSWRLFRGRKWNPLRQRIDSYTYGVHQLYLGTLFFTLLTFLLPTVMAYYIVFTTLRIAVLTVQGIITCAINLLSICPVYVIILRAFNSKLITGDFYFSVLQEQKILILNMELVQIPLQSVIQKTRPEDVCQGEPLSWKMFVHSLIWGKIIYPM